MFLDWKTQYSENEYTTQSNLQIKFNFFFKQKNFTIYMETQKTLNIQSNPLGRRMELEDSTFLTSDYTTKLQYSTGTKTEIHINGTKQKVWR